MVIEIFGHTDQRNRKASESMRERDSLRHLGHGDPSAHRNPDHCSYNQSPNDPFIGHNPFVQECAYDGKQHSQCCKV